MTSLLISQPDAHLYTAHAGKRHGQVQHQQQQKPRDAFSEVTVLCWSHFTLGEQGAHESDTADSRWNKLAKGQREPAAHSL